LAIEIGMIYFRQLTSKYPVNYAIIGLFTLSQAYVLSFTCVFTNPVMVFQAAFLTLTITIGLTVYAMTTKKDVFNFFLNY